jgi:hypothetical protein
LNVDKEIFFEKAIRKTENTLLIGVSGEDGSEYRSQVA